MIPLAYNAGSLRQRKTMTLVTALGVALVVFVLAASLMLVEGVKEAFTALGKRDSAVVLRKGSDSELTSAIEMPTIGTILSAPGVKRDAQGQPSGVGELVSVILLQKPNTEFLSNVRVRGITEQSIDFRSDVVVVAGRRPKMGTDEAMIGENLVGRFVGMGIGENFELKKGRPMNVVGVFSAAESSYESEIWADLNQVQSAFGRQTIVSVVHTRLESPARFAAFRAAVEGEKHLGLEVMRETEFYEKQSEGTSQFLGIMGKVISTFFSSGAIIGAMITMYAMVANRRREIGVLRALGFSRRSVMFSFLIESALLAGLGGIIGTLAALLLGFAEFSMMNLSGWNEIVFRFRPTAQTLYIPFICGVGMGLIGGLLPAIRAARTIPAQAIRD